MRELGSLLQRAGFALPVADIDRTMVRYADAIALMRELKRSACPTRWRHARAGRVSRRLLARAAAI